MQAEIDSQQTARAIHILGVNAIGLESGNSTITADRQLPWLQPASGDDPWMLWPIEYRDVAILGPGNELLGTFNLTEHDLSDPANFATLHDQLLTAAGD
jgi:hypothetical protein